MQQYVVEIVIAAISMMGTMSGAYFANKKATALVTYRLEQLEKKQDVHNQVIDRVYELEKSVALNTEDTRFRRERVIVMLKNCVFKVSVSTKKWMKAAGIRAIKTMAETAVSIIVVGSTVTTVDWKLAVSSAVVAGVVSLLTSVAGIPEVEDERK